MSCDYGLTVLMVDRKHAYKASSSMTNWFPLHYQPYISEAEDDEEGDKEQTDEGDDLRS